MPLKSNVFCIRCGKGFYTSPKKQANGHGKYCSNECRYAKGRVAKKCQQCGTMFTIKANWDVLGRGIYCTRECMVAARTGESLICKECGETFYVQRHRLNSPPEYCSTNCQNISRDREMTYPCTHCGIHFRARKRGQKYCSGACRDFAHRTYEIKPCTGCGKPVKWYSWHFNRYCSQECQANDLRRSSPNWESTEGRKQKRRPDSTAIRNWRAAVKNRDGRRCQLCGSTKYLHAHHIKPWKTYPELRYDIDNGLTLCRTCHIAVHAQRLPIQLKMRAA